MSVDEFFSKAVLEKIEDELNFQTYKKAITEYNNNLATIYLIK